jgi:nicotinamide-nucleotide adenylyltransferase
MILILGRFQPFHNGHLKVAREAFKEDSDIVIAIGSSQKHDEKDNPFSAQERRQMIGQTMEANNIPARIIEVPDITCDSTYADHVAKIAGAMPDKVMTENQWTIDLFSSKGCKVLKTPRYFDISSTDIREKIAQGSGWHDLVPPEVVNAIEENKGVERIRKLHSS